MLNVMSLMNLRKFGKKTEDLIKTNKIMTSYMGVASNSLGVLKVDVFIRPEEVSSTLFVIDRKPFYYIILGRDWIHTTKCMPSKVHQRFMFEGIQQTGYYGG